MQSTAKTQVYALMSVIDTVIEAINETGTEGIPGGTLYAMLMQHGCSLSQYEMIMGIIVDAGRASKRGHVYYSTKEESR